ncbi:F-box family protein [Rhynchospora pubera]|uniref:F-box family protein n=1 Tax=Rhynchospora pubera TaxID=906938 RepID=A0AAV8BR87_9POAL|nr:F-box family protein [Rhynchospora pubera]
MPELDRISDLPRDIKDNILVRLSLKEAVRTCCLSSNWRLAWSSIPELVYDKNFISKLDASADERNIESTKKMVKFVDKFLSLHDGLIRKFVIADVKPCSESLNVWMAVLFRKTVEKFKITSSDFDFSKWKVPSTFWNLLCLRELVLERCIIEMPGSFEGFKHLRSLHLRIIEISEANLTKLIATSPLLENLVLFGYMHRMNVKVDAPMLKELHLTCIDFQHVFLRTPLLVKAVLGAEPNLWRQSNVIDLLNCLQNLEMLDLRWYSMRHLAYTLDLEFSINFYHLKKLHIDMNVACKREAAVVRQLFHHAPNLQELAVSQEYRASAYETEEWAQYTIFKHLKFVKIIDYFKNHKSVLLFVAFLLASTPVLEELHFACQVKDPEFLEKLMQLKRASKKAQIFNFPNKLLNM